jgi:hypothetical protein
MTGEIQNRAFGTLPRKNLTRNKLASHTGEVSLLSVRARLCESQPSVLLTRMMNQVPGTLAQAIETSENMTLCIIWHYMIDVVREGDRRGRRRMDCSSPSAKGGLASCTWLQKELYSFSSLLD